MQNNRPTVNPEHPESHPVFIGIRRSLTVLVTISLFATVYFAKDLVLPVMLGFLLALTLSPVTRFLFRFGVPYALSAVILISLTATSISTVVIFSAGTVNSWFADAPEMGQKLRYKLSGISKTISDVRDASEEVDNLTTADAPPKVQQVVIRQPSLLDNAVSTLTSAATTAAVSFVLATFLLASGDMFYMKLVQSFKSMSGKKRRLGQCTTLNEKYPGIC
jgi:predicted PurR-regulated permease PerM